MPAAANSEKSVGSFLRAAREARGIGIEEAARVTRIGQNYLSALEQDRFESLPNTAYVKGFLRAYAQFLGVSGDEAVALYERSLAPPPQRPPEERVQPRDQEGRDRRSPSRRGRWIVPIVLLFLVIVAAYVFQERGGKPVSHPPPAPPQQQAVAPVLPPRSTARSTAAPGELPPGTKTETAPPSEATLPHGIVLKLKARQNCWLNITIDDAISQQYDLKAGDLIEWKANSTMALDIGNPGGIDAEFNGQQLKPFGEGAKPAHVVLKADSPPQIR